FSLSFVITHLLSIAHHASYNFLFTFEVEFCIMFLLYIYVPHRFCIPTSLVVGILLNYVGRKAVIVLGFSFYVVGVLVSSMGWTYQVVMTGRVLTGLK
ncbi:hypothetical protein LINPERHAP2_LOCUS7700, partial [Linum perenne]